MKKISPLLFLVITFFICNCERDEPDPKAGFTFSPQTNIKTGTVVTFTNTSTDYESSKWDFGDGSLVSVENNPTHVFDEADDFHVTLIVNNKGYKDQITETITVESNLEACFTVSPNPVKVGEEMIFTNCSEGADRYEWNLDDDDEIESTDEVPVGFSFSSPGTVTIKLTVWSGDQSDVTSQDLTIIENPAIEIDPEAYDGGENAAFDNLYLVNFSEEQAEWEDNMVEGAYEKYWNDEIGVFVFDVFGESGYNFSTFSYDTPDDDLNYDIDVSIYVVGNNAGFYWGTDLDESSYGKYQYLINDTGSEFEYYVGYYDDGWTNWINGFTDYCIYDEFNLLTVRKYNGKCYIFMNEHFINSFDWNGKFGDVLGFFADGGTTAYVSYITVYEIYADARKAANPKVFKGMSNHNITKGSSAVKACKYDVQIPLRR